MTHRHAALVASITVVLTAALAYSTLNPPAPAFDPLDDTMLAAQSPAPCVTPPLSSHSVAPQTTLIYRYVGRWDRDAQACTTRAFATWNTYLDTTPLGIRFAPYPEEAPASLVQHISVIHTFLPHNTAGAITEVTRDSRGYAAGVGVLINNNSDTVSSCLGYYKVAMHELGHVLGLSHPRGDHASSIMNDMAGKNDLNEAMPIAPTWCDLTQIQVASRQPLFPKP